MLEIILYITGFLIVSLGFVAFFGAPYVPTLKREVQDIMEIYSLSSRDTFVDIGSGDGVVLRAAAAKKARAVGYELSPWLYVISKILSRKHPLVTIKLSNFWRSALPDNTTVVYAFLNQKYMSRLERKLQDHVNRTQKPLHFISYGFILKGKRIVARKGPMSLYIFEPLQS